MTPHPPDAERPQHKTAGLGHRSHPTLSALARPFTKNTRAEPSSPPRTTHCPGGLDGEHGYFKIWRARDEAEGDGGGRALPLRALGAGQAATH